MSFGKRSRGNVATLHPDLQRVVNGAMLLLKHTPGTLTDFSVVFGWRSNEDQDRLYAAGRSQLKGGQSYHNRTNAEGHAASHAVDVVPYPWDWADADEPANVQRFEELAALMKASAKAEGVALEWGGDWTTFVDKPHFQMRANRPARSSARDLG